MERKSVFFDFLKANRKDLCKILMIFFIGIVIGIIFINNSNEPKITKIAYYVNSLKDNLKNSESINETIILKQSLKQNIKCVMIIWLLGCTLFGSFFIYIGVFYKGFSLGYTIAAIIATLGVKAGSEFAVLSLLLQNLLFLPAFFLLSYFGIRLYKIIRQNDYVNIKKALLYYVIVLIITLISVIIASFIEVYISTNFLIIFKEIF